MCFKTFLLIFVSSTISFKIEELRTFSARSIVEKLFQNTNASHSLILEFPSDNESLELLGSYLFSTDHIAFINLLQRIGGSCDVEDVGECPEMDKLVSSYIKYEVKQMNKLNSFLKSMKSVQCSTNSAQTETYLEISILTNLILFSICMGLISKIYLKIKLRFTVITAVLITNIITTYIRLYQEHLAKKLASMSLSDSCQPQNTIDYVMNFLRSVFFFESKTNCQRFIELHSISVWMDISPTLVLIEVISNIIFGWLGPLGYHLNLFYKRCMNGLSLFHLLPISFLMTVTFLAVSWVGKYKLLNKEITAPRVTSRKVSRQRSSSRSVRGRIV